MEGDARTEFHFPAQLVERAPRCRQPRRHLLFRVHLHQAIENILVGGDIIARIVEMRVDGGVFGAAPEDQVGGVGGAGQK